MPKVPNLDNRDNKKDKFSKFSGAKPRFPLHLFFSQLKLREEKRAINLLFGRRRERGEKKNIWPGNLLLKNGME